MTAPRLAIVALTRDHGSHHPIHLHACSHATCTCALLVRRYSIPMPKKSKPSSLTKRKRGKWGHRDNVSKLTTGRVAAKQQVQRPCPHAV